MEKAPRAGEIFYVTKDKPYQVITLGIHKETCERMVIYQALFGDYGTFVLPLSKFMEEIYAASDGTKVPRNGVKEPCGTPEIPPADEKSDCRTGDITDKMTVEKDEDSLNAEKPPKPETDDKISEILLKFLDADSYTEKLEILTTNIKKIDNRLINDMAASLDCIVEDGPIDKRQQELIYCLKQLSRFEVRNR
ncbi:MAG: DUF1653 domain-containing protein [Clostridiales bacterium]|nr:DUF1653 domain-containing protein [Clostridiales bacterium]